jgi:hypothetical protein
MSAEVELVGALTDEEQLVHCIGELRAARTRFRVYSPIPSEHIWRAQLRKRLLISTRAKRRGPIPESAEFGRTYLPIPIFFSTRRLSLRYM